MKIGIVGAGKVGRTLGQRWSEIGHDVYYGVRNPADSKHQVLTGHAHVLSSLEAATASEILVLSVHWPAVEAALKEIKDALCGKILVDCTNPIGADLGAFKSAAEQIQTWVPDCTVVKSFNQIGFNIMANPILDGRPTVLFVASDSKAACGIVEGLAQELDFDVVKIPSLEAAAQLEAFAMLWINMSYKLGYGREFAFSMNQRNPRDQSQG